MLLLDKATVSYAEKQWLFDLQLQTNGVYVLAGRSGSGKSTLLNLLGGFSSLESGDIQWNGESIIKLSPAQRPITTLFQQNNLFNHLTVYKNIALGIAPNLKLTEIMKADIVNVLDNVGLAGFEHKYPQQISGGEQQRVALARCLLRRKPVLLLDEPFSALDSTTRAQMLSLLNNIIREFSPCVVMITHDQRDADSMDATLMQMHEDHIEIINR